jgi:hypothetical protein
MNETNTGMPPKEDKLGAPLTIISFCIPLVGIILYFVKKNDQPKSAKTACYAALIGIGVGILANVIAGIAGIGMSGMGGS